MNNNSNPAGSVGDAGQPVGKGRTLEERKRKPIFFMVLTRLPEPEPDEAARLPSGDSGQGRDMATMQGGSGYPRDMTGGSSLV